MRNLYPLFILTLLATTLAGCAAPQGGAGMAGVEGELARLRQDQRDLARQVEHTQDNLLLMEARILDQQKLIEQLRAASATEKGTGGGEKAVPGGAPLAVTPPTKGEGTQGLSPTEIYLQAFADYAAGRYPQSILGFESYLKLYPDSEYSGNAQFWLGECYYALQRYPRAIEEFRKVVDLYPQGGKAPEALLKMAAAQLELNQAEEAKETLKILRRQYPESAAAKKSRQSE